METSLLTTKLTIPPARFQIVPRPRLIEILEESLNFNLVLVSAPAGFGKTTLLSEWTRLNPPEVRTAWFSLEEADNDPVRFWDYFIAALQTIQPGCGEKMLPSLRSSQPPSTESMLTVLINELFLEKGDFVLVLDDYHLITSQQIHGGITYLVEHLPAHFHLVIASRSDPSLPLARFRGKGLMLEIHTDDLRFTHEDTTSLLQKLQTTGFSDSHVAALNERTEGWVVGLKMAALSMKGRKDIPGFIAAFSGSQRYIMDYLMEEVLQKQSPEVRDFLLKTSVLERLNSSLCDFVTGRTDSQDILLRLEHDHLFIVPLDESRQWYRYEHLFAELLRHQLETPANELHQKVSKWFEEKKLPDEAVYHAKAARDWQRMMQLIDTYGEAYRKRGEYETLIGWFQAIPQEILRESLPLYSQYALLLAATSQLGAAEIALNYLDSVTLNDTCKGEVAFTRGTVYRYRGDIKSCIELFEKAFDLLPPDNVAMRSRAAMSLAHAQQRNSDFQEAEKWATKACELGQQAGDFMVISGAWSQIGIVKTYQGKLKDAVMAFTKSLDYVRQKGLPVGDYNLMCWVQYIMNNLEAVSENAKLAIELDKADMTALFHQAQICLIRGDVAGADIAIEKLDEASHHPTVDSHWYTNYIFFRITHALQRDDVEEASRWGDHIHDTAEMMLVARPTLARLILAQGKKEEATRLLQELYESAIHAGATLMVTQIRIYQALAADNDELALKYFTEALSMAKSEGIIRYFIDEGKPLVPLLERILTIGITPEFTQKLLDIIKEEEWQRQARKRATAPSPSPSLLSDREIEVLKLLADDVSNQHIAEKLNVSLGTVKTHVHHIIEKLEVKDRRQAVQRAKDLKLV